MTKPGIGVVAVPVRKKVRPRICLRCDREFKSDGPGHRICPKCALSPVRHGDRVFRLVVPPEYSAG